MKHGFIALLLSFSALCARAQVAFYSEICAPVRPGILDIEGKKVYMSVFASTYKLGYGYSFGMNYSRKKLKYHFAYSEWWILTQEYFFKRANTPNSVIPCYYEILSKRPRLFLGIEKPINLKGKSLQFIGGVQFSLPLGITQPGVNSGKLFVNGKFQENVEYDVLMSHSLQFKIMYGKKLLNNRININAGFGIDYVLPVIPVVSTYPDGYRGYVFTKEFNTIYFSPTLKVVYNLGDRRTLPE